MIYQVETHSSRDQLRRLFTTGSWFNGNYQPPQLFVTLEDAEAYAFIKRLAGFTAEITPVSTAESEAAVWTTIRLELIDITEKDSS